MILRRIGNKKKIAKKIQKYFPPHKIYIEPFFGAGGMFFNKPKAKYNMVNDLDSDVFNLFNVVINQKEEFEKSFKKMPVHSDLLNYWKENKETEPIKKALRFLFLSNLTYLGNYKTINTTINQNEKREVLNNLDYVFNFIEDVKFLNYDFIEFFKSIRWHYTSRPNYNKSMFIYCDPPYLESFDTYANSFTEEQSKELFDTLEETGCKFAMSEFDHPFILEQAKQRNLNVIIIGERQNLKNRRTEILVTNYSNSQQSLF